MKIFFTKRAREKELLRIQKRTAKTKALILSLRLKRALTRQGLNILAGYYDKQFMGARYEHEYNEGENY
jgi:hypothetical protein